MIVKKKFFFDALYDAYCSFSKRKTVIASTFQPRIVLITIASSPFDCATL